jgi:CRP-like cAMP-binding protein
MAVEIEILEPLFFFKDMKYEELSEFASSLEYKSVKKGDVLIRRGTPALTFYITLKGKFEISAEEGPSITIDQKGEIMGWSTVVAPFEYTGTVVALEDGALLYISSRDFMSLIQSDNELGEKVMKKIEKVAAERRRFFSGSK